MRLYLYIILDVVIVVLIVAQDLIN